MAAQDGQTEIVKLLLNAGAVVNSDDKDILLLPSYYGYREIVKLLLSTQVEVDYPSEGGVTSLYIASMVGNTEIVKLLLNAKADVNATTEDGYTPLYVAAEAGKIEVLELLIQFNGDVNAMGKGGRTPLYANIANKNINSEIVRLLLMAGAETNIIVKRDGNIYSLLDIAKLVGNT